DPPAGTPGGRNPQFRDLSVARSSSDRTRLRGTCFRTCWGQSVPERRMFTRHRRPSIDGSSWIFESRSGLLPNLARPEAVADRPDQFVRLGESHRPVHGANQLYVDLDVVHSVIARD